MEVTGYQQKSDVFITLTFGLRRSETLRLGKERGGGFEREPIARQGA
jgi:hypothetical protein